MKAFLFILILFNFSISAYASPTDFISTLIKSPQIIKIDPYLPINNKDMTYAFVNLVTKNEYLDCVKTQDKSNFQIYKVTYKSDQYKVEGFLLVPKNLKKENKYPLIIYNRGGHKDGARLDVCGLNLMLSLFPADEQSIFFAAQLRGTSGSEGNDEYGGAEINDVITMYNVLMKSPNIDTKNKFMIGWSRGGLTSYLLLKNGLQFNATVVLTGVPDLDMDARHDPGMEGVYRDLMPNYGKNKKKLLYERSAVNWPEKLRSPVLLIHGLKDENSPPQGVINLDKKLTQLKMPHKLIMYPDSGHSLMKHIKDIQKNIYKWLQQYRIKS